MRPSRWATHSASLHGLSDRLPRPDIQPTTATSRSLSPSVIITINSLIPSPTRPTQTHMTRLLFKHRQAQFVLACLPTPSALVRTLSVSHIHGTPLCGAARGGYGCTHVDCPNTTKAARSQPSQHPRHGRLHRPRLRPRPPSHHWPRCRRSPAHANGTIINTMLTLFLDLRPRVLGICPVILVLPGCTRLSPTPKSRDLVSAHHHLSPITHHPRSRSWPGPDLALTMFAATAATCPT